MKRILPMLIISLLIPTSFAWGFTTHEFICEQIYQTNEELNEMLDHEQFLRGCNAPDAEFKDQRDHHCYVARECHSIDASRVEPNSLTYFSDIQDCVEDSYFHCPALEKFDEYLNKASKSSFSFYVGASVHYFTDSHVPLHQTMGEDYWDCHMPFEKNIGNNLKSNKRSWTVTQKCDVYFPCKKAGKMPRKCKEKYTVDVSYTHEDIIGLIEKTDNALTEKLKLSYQSDYSHLLKKYPTGFFELITNNILNFFSMLTGWFKR